jgi:hypothetical protein
MLSALRLVENQRLSKTGELENPKIGDVLGSLSKRYFGGRDDDTAQEPVKRPFWRKLKWW